MERGSSTHRHPSWIPDMQSVTSAVSTSLVLLLWGMAVLAVLGARNLSTYVKEHINFSVVLDSDMKEGDILRLQRRLEAQPFVRQAEYVSKRQALEEHTRAMGTDPQEFLGYNPFSASIEVKLRSEYANPDSIARIERAIRQHTDIQDVLYQKELLQAVNDNIRRISLALLGLAGVLAFVSFALIRNTVRLAVYSQRFLIHTMKLVGASWGFIRRPFLRRYLWVGVLAAVLAGSVLWAGAAWAVSREPELGQVLTLRVMAAVSAAVLAAGVAITWTCAYFSVNRYLRMKAGELYAA